MSFILDKNILLSDFTRLKEAANHYIRKRKYELAIKMIEFASELMYNYNVILHDDEIEHQIQKISRDIFSEDKARILISARSERIVFYDFFGLDFRGLTQQYLSALFSLGYEVLYVVHSDRDSKRMSVILSELRNYPKAKIHYLSSNSELGVAKDLLDTVVRFQAKKMLIHTAPWDVPVFLVSRLISSQVETFLINITDHAFWIGKSMIDYLIEFRNQGYNISRSYRAINPTKIFLLPYYPVIDFNVRFEGFPFCSNNKKVIFSGGALTKIYGSSAYFNLVNKILQYHKNIIILYAGNGDEKYLINFIKQNGLNDRFFYIKERKDISQIMKRCVFFLNTFPISGGLLAQYAVKCGKIPLGLKNEYFKIYNFETVLLGVEGNQFCFSSEKAILSEIEKLLYDDSYRKKKELSLKKSVISPNDFEKALGGILENKASSFITYDEEIDLTGTEDIYFDLENKVLKIYRSRFLKKRNIYLSVLFPNYFVNGIISKGTKRINELAKK